MNQFDYIRPETVEETVQLLNGDGDGDTRLLAGGTDLLTLMKEAIIVPRRLLDVRRVADLPRGISESEDGVTLGALTTLSEIENSPLLQERYPLLAEAATVAATPQLRNMATLGGNLLQRPRCWYFRDPHIHCWLKGGNHCPAYEGQNERHALFGDGPCYAVHPSDLAPALLALDATVRLRGPREERALLLADLFALPEDGRRRETVIGRDELLLDVRLPALPSGTRSTYLKAMARKLWDFALVSVAATLRLEGEHIAAARIVLGGVAPIPWRVSAAEAVLHGHPPNADLFTRAADVALEDAHPLAHNGYKVPLTRNLLRQALRQLAPTGAFPTE